MSPPFPPSFLPQWTFEILALPRRAALPCRGGGSAEARGSVTTSGPGARPGSLGAGATGALLARGLVAPFPAFAVNLLEHLLEDAGVAEFLVFVPQPERRAGVLDAVVGLVLDVFFEEIPGQEAEAEASLPRADVEQVDRVEHLRLRHVDVDGAEVFREPVAHEDDAEVEQQPELLVGHLEAYECVRTDAWVEIARFEARVFG